MTKIIEIMTVRLQLRQWKMSDRHLFAAMNADPEVMQYYPAVLSEKESNEMAERLETLIDKRGWGFWAVEKIVDK